MPIASDTFLDYLDVLVWPVIAASGVAFALRLLGHDKVSIYDASLEEWATDPSLPIETG